MYRRNTLVTMRIVFIFHDCLALEDMRIFSLLQTKSFRKLEHLFAKVMTTTCARLDHHSPNVGKMFADVPLKDDYLGVVKSTV